MIVTGTINRSIEMHPRTKPTTSLSLTRSWKKFIKTTSPNSCLPTFLRIGTWCSIISVISQSTSSSLLSTKKRPEGRWSDSTRTMNQQWRMECVWYVALRPIWSKMPVDTLAALSVGKTTSKPVIKTEVYLNSSQCAFGKAAISGPTNCWWTKFGLYFQCRKNTLKDYYAQNMQEWVIKLDYAAGKDVAKL